MGMPRFSTGATGPLGAELSLSRGLGRDAIREKNERASQQNGSLSVDTVRVQPQQEQRVSQRESTEYVCAPLSTVLDRGAWSHRASVRVCVDVCLWLWLVAPQSPRRKRKMEKERQKRPIFSMLKFNFARLR